MRPRSDAATDGDRWGRVIDDGGLIRRKRNLTPLCYDPVTAKLIHRPQLLRGEVPLLFRGAQMPGKATVAAA